VRTEDLTIRDHPEILVIGDTAFKQQNGKPLPGVAQVAMQQGHYAGKGIHMRLVDGQPPKPFKYFYKGSMAVVGKGFAVLQAGNLNVSGFAAWLAWAAVHLQFLATSSLRVSVFCSMGLDISHRSKRFKADREAPRRPNRSSADRLRPPWSEYPKRLLSMLNVPFDGSPLLRHVGNPFAHRSNLCLRRALVARGYSL